MAQGKVKLVPRVVFDVVVSELAPGVNPGAQVGKVLSKNLTEEKARRWLDNNLDAGLWELAEGSPRFGRRDRAGK